MAMESPLLVWLSNIYRNGSVFQNTWVTDGSMAPQRCPCAVYSLDVVSGSGYVARGIKVAGGGQVARQLTLKQIVRGHLVDPVRLQESFQRGRGRRTSVSEGWDRREL